MHLTCPICKQDNLNAVKRGTHITLVRYTCGQCLGKEEPVRMEVMFRNGIASVVQATRIEHDREIFRTLTDLGAPLSMIDNLKLAISWRGMEAECKARSAEVPPLEMKCSVCPAPVEQPIQYLDDDHRVFSVVCGVHQGLDMAGVSERLGGLWIHGGIALGTESDWETYAGLRQQYGAMEDMTNSRYPGIADRLIDTIKMVVAWGKAEGLVQLAERT